MCCFIDHSVLLTKPQKAGYSFNSVQVLVYSRYSIIARLLLFEITMWPSQPLGNFQIAAQFLLAFLLVYISSWSRSIWSRVNPNTKRNKLHKMHWSMWIIYPPLSRNNVHHFIPAVPLFQSIILNMTLTFRLCTHTNCYVRSWAWVKAALHKQQAFISILHLITVHTWHRD